MPNYWNSKFKVKPTKAPKRSGMTQEARKPLKRTKLKKRNEKSLRSKLDKVYSLWLRKSSADKEGYITCYCGVRVPWQEADCSHYEVRRHLSLRYDPRNTTPSCRRCNRYMHGNLQAYALFLQQRYGMDILQSLQRDKQKTIRYYPYEEEIARYEDLLKTLLTK